MVHVDDDILIVEKPAGLLSVPGRFVKDSVLQRMLFDYPDARIVHRLDLDTSGLLVLALSKMAISELNRQFRERLVAKEYMARVWGEVVEAEGEIDLPIRPDPDNRPLQVIDHESGKPSLTKYQVVGQSNNETLLRLQPITGRSHQLRIHLASIGHPILGCDLYAHEDAFQAADRLMLHACMLSFTHPKTGASLRYESSVTVSDFST